MLLSFYVRLRALLWREEGQTTAEYALVILAAAAIAVVLIAWAHSSGRLPALAEVSTYDTKRPRPSGSFP